MKTASNNNIAQRVRKIIRDDAPYQVPEPADVIKLDANESPYPLSDALKDRWLECMRDIDLNRYPDGPSVELVQTIRDVWQVPDRFDVLIGNGSDELIQIVEIGLAAAGGCVMTPSPSFVVYERTADLIDARYVGVALDEKFQIELPSFLSAIDEHDPDCIFLATPNNPTGNSFDDHNIDKIASHANGLVVIDEAYGMFAKEPSLERLDRFDNVVIIRTLSKIGFAGLRVGVLIGKPEWVSELHKVRPPYNINSLSQASAIFALQNAAELDSHINSIIEQRQRLATELAEIVGLEVFSSQANFILVRANGQISASEIHRQLMRVGVAVKNLDKADTPLASCLRISVGTETENDALLAGLRSLQ